MRTDSVVRRRFGAAALLALAGGVALGVAGVPTQQAKVVATDAQVGDMFGASVALSGGTAIVGALERNSLQGAAYVFTRAGATWTQQTELTPPDAANSYGFGGAVALSGDTALVGGNVRNGAQEAAYVFTRTGATWSQQERLTASDGASGDRFGDAVALDGDTALVGALAKNSSRGAAYVFTRTGTTWVQTQELVAADGAASDRFGWSVALAGDTLLVGAPFADGGLGAVYVFTRTGTVWMQQAKFTTADAVDLGGFGAHVALAGDTALVGGGNLPLNAAYVFTRSGSTWTQQAKLTALDAAYGDSLGASVALAGDIAVVGAPGKDLTGMFDVGAAYVFRRSGTTWTQQAELMASDPSSGATDSITDSFGFAVALSGDTAFVGAYGKNSNQGAAYAFTGLVPGYCLPTKATVKLDARRPERSTLVASGTLNTGAGAPDFSGPATFDVGGIHLDVPAFVAKRNALTYRVGGIALTIVPARGGSSRATFDVAVVGDLSGKVDRSGPLNFRFANAANDLKGAVNLTAGALAPRAVVAPGLVVRSAGATLRGGGRDSLNLTLSFATDGVVPQVAQDLRISFGDTWTSALLPSASFVRVGSAYVDSAKGPGITKAIVDYARGAITIAGVGLDLGAFPAGAGVVVVTITLNGEPLSAVVRVSRTGSKLTY